MITRRSRRESARIRTSRRIRALLAAGVVFGIGAASTLAAWNDYENVSASITAGHFGIVGSVNGGEFEEHSEQVPASLNFSVPTSGLMPGMSVYSKFTIKTIDGSAAGAVLLAAGTGSAGELATYLRYGVRQVAAGAACDGTGTVVVPDGSELSASAPVAQPVGASGAEPVEYCFAVTLPMDAPNEAQGKTATPTWVFTGQNS